MKADRTSPLVWAGAVVLLAAYGTIWLACSIDYRLLAELWFMPGIGLLGAVIANTSGTGGGVVFVPVFNALRHADIIGLDKTQVTAAAFLIQCFGMSMGALRWSTGLHGQAVRERATTTRDFWSVVGIVLLFSLPSMLATQYFTRFNPHDVLIAFKLFSIVLGVAVIVTTWTVNRTRPPLRQVGRADFMVLALCGLVGGFVTALFSVGVGELVALYLFIRHYPMVLCTGAAVVISAISVLVGAPFHIIEGHVVWEVIVLAGPGAALGGFLSRSIALWLGANRMKTLDGCWIVASSMYLIVLNV